MNQRVPILLRTVMAVVIITLSFMSASAANGAALNTPTLTWSVQYMIDQSQTVLGNVQTTAPRDNRGLAISPDGKYLYAGYNNGPEVRKLDLSESDYTAATVARTTVSRGKAIAVDDLGRVYLADGGAIKILDANLSTVLYSISMTKSEGVAVQREGGTLVLYATERGGPNTLTRWELTESGGAITGATKAGLDGDGVITITGASDMRGVAIDPAGRIWIADPSATTGNGKVFRMNSDGTELVANMSVPNPYAIAFNGDEVLVTGGYQRLLSVLDMEDLSITQTLTPPWADLRLDPDGNSSAGSLTGIVVTPGGFYVTNEAGQTADSKSTYGTDDSYSGELNGTHYTDLSADDNDPILKLTIVVPNQTPVAEPGGPYLGAVNTPIAFDGSGSSDPDGNPLTYAWDFGDGNTETGVAPTHSYAVPGIYDVCLTVNDGTVDSVEVCTYVVVYDPSGGFVTGGGWIDSPAGAVAPVENNVFFNGFETDIEGWVTPTRVMSGNNGILSASGGYHAEATNDFTRWGGYNSVFPAGGFVTSIDVYLDMGAGYANDTRFDWTSAISAPDGSHRRDFIFNGGFYSDTTEPGAGLNRFVFSASNNTPGWPKNPGRDPIAITATGWYTLQHHFYDSGAGVLAVDLSILDANGNLIHTWTLSDPTDIIGSTVGGNRYGWFVTNGFPSLAIDNSVRKEFSNITGKATFGFVSKYKKGASIPDGNTEFQFKAGDLNFHSTSYDWLVVNQGGTNAQFKGSGTINGAGDYQFMLWAGDGSPDTFRIKIWDAATEVVVYDNGMAQPIGGGSIVVHKK